MATGTGGAGGVGSPGAPQPAIIRSAGASARNERLARRADSTWRDRGFPKFPVPIFDFRSLQDITAQILILDDIRKLFGHVGGIHFHILFLQVWRFEGKFIENLLEDGMQPPRTDVFGRLVDARGEACDGRNGILGKVELDAFGLQKRDVLLDEGVFWLSENPNEIFFL